MVEPTKEKSYQDMYEDCEMQVTTREGNRPLSRKRHCDPERV